ncbi:MAG: threonylcarbamoyl-AMP synthase [Oscillospiraceae bacterium]|jgi:L-threonylcarbamoyladenylate synthase|nr:threonylcarbamoyl-AMP synthase [Oscillospiraceae bacterium]
MQTRILKDNDLSYAVATLINGGLVGVPTETVYGLAGNGFDAAAVAKIYEVKGRPEVKPLSLLVPSIEVAKTVCAEFPEDAYILAKTFWPGPLTIVLPVKDTVPSIVTADGDTIGVRCPDHAKTLRLLGLAGVPAAAPSANISDKPSPKNAYDVLAYFDGKIECIIDGGECTIGVESTVISLVTKPYKIFRQGALSEEDIYKALKKHQN